MTTYQFLFSSRSGFEKLVQNGPLEADELRKRAQQAVRHRLATETDAPQEKVTLLDAGRMAIAEKSAGSCIPALYIAA